MQPQNLAALRRLMMTAASQESTRLLSQQTVDGHRVDVVLGTHRQPDNVNGSKANLPPDLPWTATFTLCTDAFTYVLQRLDEQQRKAQGAMIGTSTLRVLTYEVMPEAQAPAGIFAYTHPLGAQVQRCNAATAPVCTTVHPSQRK